MIEDAAQFHKEFGPAHVADLLQHGWTICLAPDGVQDDAKIAYAGIDGILTLSPLEQMKWAGQRAHEGQIDMGLRPVQQTTDPKRIFHYAHGLEAELACNGIDVTGEWSLFFEANRRNRLRCKRLEGLVCSELGVGNPSADHDFVRLLRYEPASVGAMMGQAHWDRCAISFLFAGTHPGVRISARDAYDRTSPELCVVELGPDQVLITVSAKFAGLTGGRLKPIWHDVISTVANVHRYVQIFFTHCGLPDTVMPPGFSTHNYDSLARVVRAYHTNQPAAQRIA